MPSDRGWPLAGWIALACSAVFASSTGEASAAAAPVADDDGRATADPADPANPPTVRVRFLLALSQAGRRTVIVDEDSGRQTPVGEVAAGVVCETRVSTSNTRDLTIKCGSGLEVMVFDSPATPFDERALGIRGSTGVDWTGDIVSDDLPLPREVRVELDGTLDDPVPAPSCDGVAAAPIQLSLEHVSADDATWKPAEVQVRANGMPLEAHVVLPGRGAFCVAKGDAEGHHYEYICHSARDPHDTSLTFDVRNRTLYATETERVVADGGRHEAMGILNVSCAARLLYPRGTEILPYEEGMFGSFADSPEDVRAHEEQHAELDRELGIAPP
jgi:hypothetical protein